VRLWEHQVEKDLQRCARRIMTAVGSHSNRL
jgi:hypothetical protein